MNINLPYLPERQPKPRTQGLTMAMDKGLSLRETENFIESSADYVDLAKLAFGTAVFSKNVEEKIALYKQANIKAYFGGTMFEAFIIRNMFDDFRRFIEKMKVEVVEVSDGSMHIDHKEKLGYIKALASQVTVVSEVGSKVSGVVITQDEWVNYMKTEMEAGSWKVIAEARESGTIGIYHSDGSADNELIHALMKEVGSDKIIWEAPNKSQQAMFIQELGAHVNLGNVAPAEVISLESLRLGLRGDTFFRFLPQEYQSKKQL